MAKLIMTADDSASVRQMVAFTLKQSGYEVVEAVDGRDALNKLNSQKVDMLLTDLNMPNMDGIGLIKGCPLRNLKQIYTDHHADNRIAGFQEGRR
jgi:two-component system chemotaxis response regulator CheY